MTGGTTFAEALRFTIHELARGKRRAPEGVLTAEAERLLETALARDGAVASRMELYSRARDHFPQAAWVALREMVAERASGRPLQHVTGRQVFLEHEFEVTPDVLIPRPETEALVAHTIGALKEGAPPTLGLEIGVGSGVISIELLAAFAKLRILASEASEAAAQVAIRNAAKILGEGQSRLTLLPVPDPSQVCEPLLHALESRRADFLVSNPPYLESSQEADSEVSEYEPAMALYAPARDPLHFYRAIANQAGALLMPGSPVILEIPHERASRIREVFIELSWDITIHKDLTGRDRILVAKGHRAKNG